MRRRLLPALTIAALLAAPAVVSSQDLTTLLAVFLRNLHAGRIVIPQATAFANLTADSDGTIVYCSDCLEGSDPASGSSTGAFVLRVNGRWAALDGGSGGGAPTNAEYIVSEANGSLSNEVAPSGANQVPVSSSSTAAAWGTLPLAGIGGGTSNGDTICFDGSNWVRVPVGAIGQFLRVNTTATPACEWATGPNVADQDADVSNSSNVTFTNLTDMAATPAADTWVRYECQIHYSSAAATTGITIGLFVNNGGATAAPQFMNVKWVIGGAGGVAPTTLSSTTDQAAYTTASLGVLTSLNTGTAANQQFLIEAEGLILTHATASDTLIFPIYRSEVNTSAVTIKEGSSCSTWVLHVDS